MFNVCMSNEMAEMVLMISVSFPCRYIHKVHVYNALCVQDMVMVGVGTVWKTYTTC